MSEKLLFTSAEFVRAPDVAVHRRGYDSDWGGWRLEGLELVYPAYGSNVYPIDLERFTSSAKMLDTVMQVAGKTWATNDCVAGLVRALDYLLQPQGTLCSCGQDKKLTTAQIRKCVQNSKRSK
jgi:hypothetical protein